MYDWLKGLTFLIAPSGALITAALISGACALFWRSRRLAVVFSVFAGLLAAVACLPIGYVCLSVLEHRFPEWRGGESPVAGMVMLDGGVDRIPFELALARRYPHARVIFAGRQKASGGSFALLRAAGLDPSVSVSEGRSRDTYDNAVFSLAIAKPKAGERWLLVTSAAHMPRSVATFRRVGFPVTAAPVALKTDQGMTFANASASEALTLTDEAFREAWALVAYRLTGRTRELWPKP